MVLQDLFDTLASGEFANLSLAHSVSGTIKEEAYPRIVSAANRGLREIYKKFLLKKKKVMLFQLPGVVRYYLRPEHIGVLGAPAPGLYLANHPDEAFADDIIQILRIQDVDNNEVDLNPLRTYLDQTYFKTASFDSLDLFTTKTDQVFTIEYQAKHPKIEITETFDPKTIPLSYPDFIEEALTLYMASLLIQGKTTKASEAEGYQTNTWHYKYLQACAELVHLGLAEETDSDYDKFYGKGFV